MRFGINMVCGLLGAFLFLQTAALAQEKMALTLEQSVSIALQKNPEIQTAEKEAAKAKAGIWEAVSNILPAMDVNANYQHAWEIQETTIPNFLKPALGPLAPPGMPDYIKIAFGLQNTFTYGAILNQPLFLGGAGLGGIRIARAAGRAAEHSLESKKQFLIYQAAQAFYSCLLAKELVRVQHLALEQSRANLDIVKKRYDAGTASGFDKMRAEVEVANLKPEVITTENNYRLAVTNLRTVLGLARTIEIEPQGEMSYVEDDSGDRSLEEIQKTALLQRPEVLAVREQKSMASTGITLAASNFLPKLFFQTSYSYMAMRNDHRFQQGDFSKGFTSALSLQIPLFHGFRSAKQYQKARLDYKIALDGEKQVQDGVSAEAEMAYHKFGEARQKYGSARESIALAEEALRLASLMYEEGVSTQLDVLSSQLALNRSRLNFAQSLFEYQMARYQLKKATGNLKGVL